MNIYEQAIKLIENNEDFAFATITSHSGSTPRETGAMMIVKSDGSIFGSVGGGSVEATCIKHSINVIKSRESMLYKFTLNKTDIAKLGMICGGTGEIQIDFIDSNLKSNLERFNKNLKENISKAYIFGAGHISKDVAVILSLLEFRTIVIDDREEFANSERFPHSEVVVLDSFENIPDFPIDENSYIIILTRGHLYDSSSLEWALKTNPCYIGMIGSRTKIGLTYEKLMKKGFSKQELNKVHAPIGIKLDAQTPAEIAVCIAAELINCRANKEKRN
ncbi:XdhC family protein [Clostridioides sp. ES-S-0005-03]|uniref:XdhC family protein n=1 Tax=Clostridioides sp. ES-S-0005-03 TaxID=2770774 RepID=UPI001D12D45A|nr:XdhC family protein [Clostridioides sp. ES-S-0005-03]UDN48952.1 XdhC family protein [Clostridioides sp. ES-S-0173-01]